MYKVMASFFLVALGGALGSAARYGIALGTRPFSTSFPLGTLIANTLGCFIIAIITELAATRASVPPALRLFIATGFCGGFTTLSSFICETGTYFKAGDAQGVLLNTAATLILPSLAFASGIITIRFFLKG